MQKSCWSKEGYFMSNSKYAGRSSLFRRFTSLALGLASCSLVFALPAHAQSKSAPAPDVIVFTNGDKLSGKLLREVGGTVTFHSDVAGDINVTWDKIKSLQTSQNFAVIRQGQEVSRKTPESEVPKGKVSVQDQQVQVNGAAAMPAKNAQYLIDEDTYTNEVRGNPSWRRDWVGSVTAGAALVQATQNSRSFTGSATAVRTIPNVTWLDPRNRTTLDFNAAYGSLSQPSGTTTITTKTNIIHGDAEHDWYITRRFYFLVDASWDHNFSQGLSLQQIYGVGAGYTLIKTPKEQLDLKADVHYERQHFGFTPGIFPPVITPDKDLVGANFGDTYLLKLPHGLLFNQGLVVTPAFNQAKAFSAIFTAGLVFPVYKRIAFTVGTLDDYLNDPAVGSKKNSFQFTGGLTYTF
jgi:hypothetical protein